MNITKKPSAYVLAKLERQLSYSPTTGTLRWRNMPARFVRYNGRVAGSLDQKGYRVVNVRDENGKQIHVRAHKIAWFLAYHVYPLFDIDHQNRDRDCQVLTNLRRSTPMIEKYNRCLMSSNRSGVRGVSIERDGRYRAEINYDGHAQFLGRFTTLEAATAARKRAEINWYGRLCPTNDGRYHDGRKPSVNAPTKIAA